MDNNQRIRISGYKFIGVKDSELFSGETTWEQLSKVLTTEERNTVLQKFQKGETATFFWGEGQTNYNLISQEISV